MSDCDDVYRERNYLAIAFIAAVMREAKHAELENACGWCPDGEDDEFVVVWVDDENYGQLGWHVPRDLVPEWLPRRDPDYDGYTTADKYDRLIEGWVEGGC